jgi:hypothetical protein
MLRTTRARAQSAPLNQFDQYELSMMPKSKPPVGPMRTQNPERGSTLATPVLPLMPAAGNVKKTVQPKQTATRADGVLVAKAKITRRNSLRKQRDALKGS